MLKLHSASAEVAVANRDMNCIEPKAHPPSDSTEVGYASSLPGVADEVLRGLDILINNVASCGPGR